MFLWSICLDSWEQLQLYLSPANLKEEILQILNHEKLCLEGSDVKVGEVS